MSESVGFKNVKRFILFGGGNLLVKTARYLLEKNYDVRVCTASRHFRENLTSTGAPLEHALKELKIPYLVTDRVNECPDLMSWITADSLGIGFGPAWIFGDSVCDAFGKRFVNFMGIRMPHYLGGAHYTWQILRKTRVGAANFQMIEKRVNTGPVLFNFEFLFHPGCNTPQDFFDRAEGEEFSGIKNFLDQVFQQKTFSPRILDGGFAQYYPSLNTEEQGWIDWSWTAEEITLFINAFGRPYKGASTFFDGKRVFLHDALLETSEGGFHPFQRGMIFRVSGPGLWIAARDGAVLVRSVKDGKEAPIPPTKFGVGRRFFTPTEQIERALKFEACYGASGLKTEV